MNMDNLTRKDFLRMSSWGIVATLLPIDKVNALSAILTKSDISTNDDYRKAQELAKQAKLFFYKKEFKKAEELYLQCIILAPKSIRFYDNLDNVYGAKSDVQSSVVLYKNGLLNNPDKCAFYDRLSRALMRLELGDYKKAKSYKSKTNSNSLLEDAKSLIQKALLINPNLKYLSISLLKIEDKIELNKITEKKTSLLLSKGRKKSNRQKFKNIFKEKSNDEIVKLLDKVVTKKRVTLYHIKEIEHQKHQVVKQVIRYNRVLLSKLGSESPERLEIIEKIFKLNPKDDFNLFQLKKEFYKNKRYADFIAIREEFAEKKETFYSKLGMMDAIEKAYLEKQINIDYLDKAIKIGTEVYDDWSLLENKRVDLANKLSKIYLLKQNFNEAKIIIEDTIKLTTTNDQLVVNKLLYSYANIFYTEQNFEKSKIILQIALSESDGMVLDDTFNNIKVISKNKKTESFKDKLSLYYLLYKVHKALNNVDQANLILDKLQFNNPKDQFVLTRK
jgi:serine/threonine protein kinase